MSKLFKVPDKMINWFPDVPNKKNFLMTRESLYSISHKIDADKLSNEIAKIMKTRDISITDACANIGGNTMSFARNFKLVNAVELDATTCSALRHNITLLNCKNVNIFCGSYLKIYDVLEQDVLFIDAPWGGSDYKKRTNLMLYLDKIALYDVLNAIQHKPKLAVLKVPKNFAYDDFRSNIKQTTSVWKSEYDRYNVIFASMY